MAGLFSLDFIEDSLKVTPLRSYLRSRRLGLFTCILTVAFDRTAQPFQPLLEDIQPYLCCIVRFKVKRVNHFFVCFNQKQISKSPILLNHTCRRGVWVAKNRALLRVYWVGK